MANFSKKRERIRQCVRSCVEFSVFCGLKVGKARPADHLALKINCVILVSAENAGCVILRDYYLVPLGEEFDGVGIIYMELVPHLLGNNDAAKLVNITYYAGRFHKCFLLLIDTGGIAHEKYSTIKVKECQ